jgi:signal transduction histidine kinase
MSVAKDVPIIETDPGKLQQVLYNFLSNALKFTPAGGRVELAAAAEDADTVRFSVTDTGPGIPRNLQKRIFEKFYQGDPTITREHEGAGLGLAISAELARLLRAEIQLDSQPGKGSTFTLRIPIHIEGRTEQARIYG